MATTFTETTRRRAIEDAASALFRERGYAATSVRDIARVLEIQGASLYAHVTSKEDVLWAIVDRAATRFEEVAQRVAGQAQTHDPLARLETLIRGHVRVMTDDIGDAGVFVHEWRSLDPEHRDDIRARRNRYEQAVRGLIEEGMAAGQFVPTDPAIAAAFILSSLNGLSVWYRPDGRLTPDRIADHHVDLALRALTGEPR